MGRWMFSLPSGLLQHGKKTRKEGDGGGEGESAEGGVGSSDGDGGGGDGGSVETPLAEKNVAECQATNIASGMKSKAAADEETGFVSRSEFLETRKIFDQLA